MMPYKSSSPRIRLFRNDLLERLTQVSPAMFALTWAAVLALSLYAAWGLLSLPLWIALFLLGMAIWTLFEYAMHRFFFHMKLNSALGREMIFITHGNHHVAPGDRLRNIMPPVVTLFLYAVIWGALWLMLGNAGPVFALGFASGYVIYDGIHYACHQLPMRHPLLRRLRRHHILHHHAKQEGNFAITAIFWDRVFGTDLRVKGG